MPQAALAPTGIPSRYRAHKHLERQAKQSNEESKPSLRPVLNKLLEKALTAFLASHWLISKNNQIVEGKFYRFGLEQKVFLELKIAATTSKIRSAWWAWTAGPQFSRNWLPQLPCFMCTSCRSTLYPPSTSRAWSRPELLFLSLARHSVNPCMPSGLH